MRKVLRVIVLLIIVVTISACGKNSKTNLAQLETDEKEAQTVTLSIAQGRYKGAFKNIQEKLKREENIKLVIETVPDEQYYSLSKTRITAGEVPDIMVHNAPQQYREYNVTKNMVDLSMEPWVDRMLNPDLFKTSEGNIYAMPLQSSGLYIAVYYNKKVFYDLGLSEPKTYTDFLHILETIKTKGNGITPIYMSNKDTWTTQIFMTAGLPILLGDKADETFDKILKNQLKWTEVPEFKTILTQFQALYKKEYVNQDHLTSTFENAKAAWATGKAAMVLNAEGTPSDLVTSYNIPPDDIGAFVIPFGDRDIIATGDSVAGFFIPKKAKNIDGAKKVLNLMSQPDYLNMYFRENPGFPGFKNVDGGQMVPAVRALEEKYIRDKQYTFEMNDRISITGAILNDGLWRLYVDLALGLKTPEQVIEEWQETFSEYMKQKNQPGF